MIYWPVKIRYNGIVPFQNNNIMNIGDLLAVKIYLDGGEYENIEFMIEDLLKESRQYWLQSWNIIAKEWKTTLTAIP